MKICINQYAFVAAMVCISTALHSKHTPLSSEELNIMLDQSSILDDNLKSLYHHANKIEQEYQNAMHLDYKDKTITAKRRSEIRKLQSQASHAHAKLHAQMKNIQHFLEKTSDQIIQSTQQTAENTTSLQTTARMLPKN